MRPRTWPLLTLAALLVLPLPSTSAQDVGLQLLEAPSVIVANDPANMTAQNPDPDHPFSAQVRVTNDGTERRVTLFAISYMDRSIQGCPEHDSAIVVSMVTKNLALDPNEQRTLGGSAAHESGQSEAFWPMAVSRAYHDPRTNETKTFEQGEHAFCITVRVSSNDPACDAPEGQTCTLARDDWRAFVRHTNQAPVIEQASATPAEPRAGQQVVLRAQARDADTVPSPDTLIYTWDLGREEKTGSVVQHTFHTGGEQSVTLRVSDGFDTVERTLTLQVGGSGSTDGDRSPSPGPGAMAAVLAGFLVALAAQRRK